MVALEDEDVNVSSDFSTHNWLSASGKDLSKTELYIILENERLNYCWNYIIMPCMEQCCEITDRNFSMFRSISCSM